MTEYCRIESRGWALAATQGRTARNALPLKRITPPSQTDHRVHAPASTARAARPISPCTAPATTDGAVSR